MRTSVDLAETNRRDDEAAEKALGRIDKERDDARNRERDRLADFAKELLDKGMSPRERLQEGMGTIKEASTLA